MLCIVVQCCTIRGGFDAVMIGVVCRPHPTISISVVWDICNHSIEGCEVVKLFICVLE